MESENQEVRAAFEALRQAIETAVDACKLDASQTMQAGDLENTEILIERCRRIQRVGESVRKSEDEWENAFRTNRRRRRQEKPARSRRRNLGRLPKGARLAEGEYRQPILQTLVEMGGSGSAGEVLDRVFARVKTLLSPADLEGNPSQPTQARWRNTAQWCKLGLVRDGLLKRKSPHGIWETTERGRDFIRRV